MKLMCVNCLSLEEGYITPLTPGKIYDAVIFTDSNGWSRYNLYKNYKVINDAGFESWEMIENFITLEEWREQQINKLICK